jgi:hypothetical protein
MQSAYETLCLFNQRNTVKCMSDYRRGLDSWLDLLITYTITTHDYNLQITDTHLVSSVYYSLHKPFPGNGF